LLLLILAHAIFKPGLPKGFVFGTGTVPRQFAEAPTSSYRLTCVTVG
jgi:hypothetical protein